MRWAGFRASAEVGRVLARGQFSRYGGPTPSITDRFEAELARAVGARHALAVNSGTSALICALVGAGIGPGDEVLVPAYTWVSSAAAVVAVGAVPVLVDIDESLTIDPDDASRRCTEFTRAVIPVHMNNLVCAMDAVLALARDRGLLVIEDACQAVGVRYGGRCVGTIGDAGAFSFNQHKNITSGEGGAVVTDDELIAGRAGTFHDVGSWIRPSAVTDVPPFVGMNLRAPEMSSAMLRPQLRRLDDRIRRRQERRALLIDAMDAAPGFEGRVAPHNSPTDAAALAIRFDDEEAAIRFATKRGVTRLLDSGRHVFTNWQPILAKRTHDDRVNPWLRHPRPVEYAPECYGRTLDVLSRSCTVGLPPSLPLAAFSALARTLFR